MSNAANGKSGALPINFARKAGPWLIFVSNLDALVEESLDTFAREGGVVRRLDARAMTSPQSLFAEFSSRLCFPGYFGRNWDALIDCLDNLHGDWHGNRNVVVVIDNFEELRSAEHLSLFVSVLAQAGEKANADLDEDGEPFYRDAIALHFVLAVDGVDPSYFVDRLHDLDRSVSLRGPYLTVE